MGTPNITKPAKQSGQTLVEFVIVMPFVIVLLVVATYLGSGLLQYHVTSSHLRGLHKNLETYASISSPLGQMQADIANGYTVTEEGGNRLNSKVIKVSKTYSIPNIGFIPDITLMSSTAVPGALMEGIHGPAESAPATYPAVDPANNNGSPAIVLAESNLFRTGLCSSMDYCYGRDLTQGPAVHATASLAPYYGVDEFSHVADPGEHELAFPGGVVTDGGCGITPASLGDSSDLTAIGDPYEFATPDVTGFLADTYNVPVHPQCRTYCLDQHAGGTQADFDSCIYPCLAGKLDNAQTYVAEHVALADSNGGCNGESIATALAPIMED